MKRSPAVQNPSCLLCDSIGLLSYGLLVWGASSSYIAALRDERRTQARIRGSVPEYDDGI
ncbi:uncharacterized protein BDV17DRAFT_249884 [Aspergillus undulatus]|uniref:uncharacterized protein n=1 Tax=Aspergillus undulatus TaxID=1810928 RepID=UPI003CCC98E1